MKIIKLTAENIKKLRAVEITPKGNTVMISGKNGQGKTSVLDSIWLALGGGNAGKEITMPIRKGQETASVTLDLGDLKVVRTWTRKGSYLNVTTKDGAKYPSPQALIDGLIGNLSFDPLAFTNLDEKAQVRTLLSIVKLEIDPEKIDAKIRSIYEDRAIQNRGMKNLEARLSAIPKPAPDLPTEETPAGEIMAELEEANKIIYGNNKLRNEIPGLRFNVGQAEAKVLTLGAEKKKLVERLAEVENDIAVADKQWTEHEEILKAAQAKVAKLQDPDVSQFKTRMAETEKLNARIRQAKVYNELNALFQKAQAEVEAKSKEIDALAQLKVDTIKKAKFPVAGLGFDESGVTFNEIPFAQCAASEQLRISMAIAMALNPKLRIIRILDGSLLDEDNLKVLQETAKENDFQVWCEVVDSSGKIGVYIEDGQVKAEN
jgi:DNA repair exonuclease SbcCD ATPase subunit